MRARALIVLVLVVLTVLMLAAPASADPVGPVYDKFFGCEGKFQWPCPGPVIW